MSQQEVKRVSSGVALFLLSTLFFSLTTAFGRCLSSCIVGDAPALAPKLSIEAVIATNPAVIIASGMGEQRPDWLDNWRQWRKLKAVQANNLYFIPPDIIQRHTPRILNGASLMCQHLQASRKP